MASAYHPNTQAEINKLFSLQKQYALERRFSDLERKKNALAQWNPLKVAERRFPFYAVFVGVITSATAMYTVHRSLVVIAIMSSVALFLGLFPGKISPLLVVEALGLSFMFKYGMKSGITMTVVFLILTALAYLAGKISLRTIFAEKIAEQEKSKQQSIAMIAQHQGVLQDQGIPLAQRNKAFDIFTGASRTPETVQDIIDVLASGGAYDIDSAVRAHNEDIERVNALRAKEQRRINEQNRLAAALQRMAFWNSMQLDAIEDELRRR
ncbi:hypothetical protein [Corynebacterium sp. HMSC27B11]|uniref:hypothetical protein n=1 Tax=Corynebacterium sp. HMSC27B11 TaxID=1581065 RepID=UPI0008A62E01|nr:hypothetical protein [Corynebacterium sp. HMSC27B11]OFS16929.1 hypothetical protein HMPREF3097_07175 [Corynebacterium sp. HMSC27B11]